MLKMHHHKTDKHAYNNPSEAWLVLSPTLWALWVASIGLPPIQILIAFVVGVITAFAFGRLLLAYIKHGVSITKIHTIELLALYLLITAACLIATSWFTIWFSIIGIIFALISVWLRKKLIWHAVFKALTINWPVPLAFIAIEHHLSSIVWIIYATGVVWTLFHLAHKYYLQNHHPVNMLGLAILSTLSFILFIFMGTFSGQSTWYFIGLMIIMALYILQLAGSHQHMKRVYRTHWWIALIIFIGILLSYHY